MTIRTRFAPSPTGYLHIGGARTALFAWLFARHHGGQFVLRIEDTDRERSTDASVQAIFDGMNWLGLDWDEVPVYQTARFDRYRQVIAQLLEQGHAYRCYCSKQRLQTLREQQMTDKQKPRYDGRCRHQAPTDTSGDYVIRFKNPESGSVQWDDLVRGSISIDNSELDDLIIQRSDGTPTYNFCVVVDDSDANMTHILRGDDHINNTPRQINLYRALGVEIPKFGHLPMILASDGSRLSKRHGAVSVTSYRDQGYLPEAVLNYIVRLGWSKSDQEIFSRQEMIDAFTLDGINRSPAIFNPEKLSWLNQQYMKTASPDYLAAQALVHFQQLGIDSVVDDKLIGIVDAQRERCKSLVELAEKSTYFYQAVTQYDDNAQAKHFKPSVVEPLQLLKTKLQALINWDKASIHDAIQQVAQELGIKLGKFGPAVRVAVTGDTMSPSLDTTLLFIGQATSIERLQKAIETVQEMAS